MPTVTIRTTLKRQRGMATLAVGLILLIAMTILTFNVAKVGGVEQRISANDVRTIAAHEAAQAGIEQAIAYLNANLPQIDSAADARTNPAVPAGWRNSAGSPRWRLCTTSERELPCGDGQNNRYGNTWLTTATTLPHQISMPGSPYTTTVHYLTESTAADVVDVRHQPRIIIIASAAPAPTSDPLAGSAVIQQIVQDFSLLNAPRVPIASGGAIDLIGNVSLYGDPNPDRLFYTTLGSNKPLSLWSKQAVTVGGSAKTCRPGPTCTGEDKLSDKNTDGGDIVRNDSKFPSDLFEHIFGIPDANAVSLIKPKSTVLSDCSSLTGASSGLFWITGNCSIGDDIGSEEAPAIIVMDGGSISINGGAFYGIIYLRNSASAGGVVKLAGGPVLYGGLAAQFAPTYDMGGTPTFRYLDFSRNRPTRMNVFAKGFAKVPGGWLDAYQKPVS